jgi:hypothetical protein
MSSRWHGVIDDDDN